MIFNWGGEENINPERRPVTDLKASLSGWISGIIGTLTDFERNLNKITPEFIDSIGIDNIPNIEYDEFEKLKKAPRDIKSYPHPDVLRTIVRNAKLKLSKSEVKKLQTDVLLNTPDLLVLIPKSHQTSCYYGSGTRWCTTQASPDYYNRYMTNGVLIYAISKNEKPDNRWYKTAFFIDKQGKASAFDAPDKPSTIEEAKKGLGKYWEPVRDSIVDYLHENKLKGIEEFYFGGELISWLESKGLDPLEVLDQEEIKKKIGSGAFFEYLNKRKINPYDYLDFPTLLHYALKEDEKKGHLNLAYTLSNIWGNYLEYGINPLSKVLEKNASGNLSLLELAISENKISVDSFLEQVLKLNVNIFEYLNNKTTKEVMTFFGNSIDLLFGFAETTGINLFESLNQIGRAHV